MPKLITYKHLISFTGAMWMVAAYIWTCVDEEWTTTTLFFPLSHMNLELYSLL